MHLNIALLLTGRRIAGTDLFRDKTLDLNNQTVKVVAFSHLPGTAKVNFSSSVRAFLRLTDHESISYSGTEVEVSL